MKKFKKILSLSLSAIMMLSMMNIGVFATEISRDELSTVGTELMATLLERQYQSFVDGEVCNTSDILANTEKNNFYKNYLTWYIGSSQALGEGWTEFDYDLYLTNVDNNSLKFSGRVRYWVEDCCFEWSESDIVYEISISEENSRPMITSIETTAGDFNDFKRLIESKSNKQRKSVENLSEADIKGYVDDLINDSRELNIAIEATRADEKDVVDMEQNFQTSLDERNVATRSAAYSYNGERGRNYADIYATSPNPYFYYVRENDCTNFVSQCVWAAYGGWTSSDSNSTMQTNINNGKRMQARSSSSNWFAGSGGGGIRWESVTSFWDFLNTSNSIGPRATKHNNNSLCTNIYPGDILTGQVLQVRQGSSGNYGHSVFVAGGVNDTYSNIKVAQHTENRIRSLSNLINNWGGTTDCYIRQLKFQTAYFNS